jgi:hypothetical protein
MVLLLACGDGRQDVGPVTTGEVTATDTSDSGMMSNDGGDKFDIGDGMGTAGDEGQGQGCDKVDFLFVVDNSGSMSDEQQNLITSFPGFIGTISDTLEAQDYHIMAVSTDNGEMTGTNASCTNGECTCTPAPVCCVQACSWGSNSCNGFDCNNLPIGDCDTQYGAGQTYDADGNHCMLDMDRRWMTDTQPNLETSFNCIAKVGTYGSGDEKPMLAMTEAVSEPLNDPGGCDEGFLRSDAILVVTFITDEEDDHGDGTMGSPGDPPDWVAELVAAKGGNPDSIVVLGLFGDNDVQNGVCPPGGDPNNGGDGAEPGVRLRQFTESFKYGVVGSVCAPDYTQFFQDAVSIIDTTCEEFIPPG